MTDHRVSHGPGLFEITRPDGDRAITNVRKLAGHSRGGERRPGARLVGTATWLLGVLATGLFAVSLAAQYQYISGVKHHQVLASGIEAAGWDAAMVIFSLLALGLARAGQPARTERALILAAALGSAGMNYAAADARSVRSVAAYVVPPVLLAVVVDRVIAVVRRHYLGDAERSAWVTAATALALLARVAGLGVLYGVRLVVAPVSTLAGFRRQVLALTPLPAAAPASAQEPDGDEEPDGEDDGEVVCQEPAGDRAGGEPGTVCGLVRPCARHEPGVRLDGETKKAHLLRVWAAGFVPRDRAGIGEAARTYAPHIQLSEGTARAYLYQHLDKLSAAGGAS